MFRKRQSIPLKAEISRKKNRSRQQRRGIRDRGMGEVAARAAF